MAHIVMGVFICMCRWGVFNISGWGVFCFCFTIVESLSGVGKGSGVTEQWQKGQS